MSTFSGRNFAKRSLVAVFAAIALAAVSLPAAASALPMVSVIVQKAPSAGQVPQKTVEALGGSVGEDLSIIDGFSAKVPANSVAALRGSVGVRYVTEDAPVHVLGLLGDVTGAPTGTVGDTLGTVDSLTNLVPNDASDVVDAPADPAQVDPALPAEATQAPQPVDTAPQDVSVYKSEIGATDANAQGVSGAGVTVALIDTGVADVPDIRNAVLNVKTPLGGTRRCVDLSGDRNCNDSYGHGTFIAGLIAGNGSQSGGKYAGVAPKAKILSVKIAGADGSASVGKILFAIQWVVNHKAQYGVDVLNLSLGTDSRQSYKHDPLNLAVERAWNHGINVVVSAGNSGPDAGTISKPADDPLVITTGAVDDLKTTTVSDDILPDFSSRGPTAADGLTKPDITAPGAHLISLRAPNSAVEQNFPGGGVDAVYRRGSGTSQSAGVVSGSVALLLSAHPELTPNQVKYALTHSTTSVASSDANAVGAGLINVGAAVASPPVGEANQGVVPATGDGSLELSAGSVRLAAHDGTHLLGLLNALLPIKSADPANPTGGNWYGTSWYGGNWYGGNWSGGSWYGQPAGGNWYGGNWYGGNWYGGNWYGGSWYGGNWYGVWD